MTIKFLKNGSKEIEQVIALGSKYSKTLGFMPEGAFREHANKGFIAVAIEEKTVKGYILFRIVKKSNRLTIAHLCVDKPYRQTGIPKQLVDAVKDKYQSLVDGIILSCRRDYKEATNFWERYGFKIVKYQSGKTKAEEKQLIKWYYNFGKQNLFHGEHIVNIKEIAVTLDTNIIVKLRDSLDNNHPETVEVKSLFADWLSDYTRYYYASEFNNEINRHSNWDMILKSKNVLSNLIPIRADVNIVRQIESKLIDIIKGNSLNDISDRRQLAESIASNIEFFITLDNDILDKSEDLYDEYKISVYRPAEFIAHLDHILNQYQYHPSRLAGACYEEKKVYAEEFDDLIDTFINTGLGEKKIIFRNQVYPTVASAKDNLVKLVKSPDGKYVAFWGCIIEKDSIEIRFIRVKGELANTLFKQLIANLIKLAVSQNKTRIFINDSYISHEFIVQLQEYGFFRIGNSWVKIVIHGLVSVNELDKRCDFIKDIAEISDLLNKCSQTKDQETKDDILYTLERALYPIKFYELNISTFIVPIKAYWASQLFEYHLANSTLYGSKPELSWNRENVYYRSPKPGGEKPFSRILWYISYDDNYPARSKAITACSYLDEVIIGSAKSMFKKYKRFGVYEWKNVLEKAGGNVENIIKILKFSDTEVFKNPVKLKSVQSILNKDYTFVSPVKIEADEFLEIYKKGNLTE